MIITGGVKRVEMKRFIKNEKLFVSRQVAKLVLENVRAKFSLMPWNTSETLDGLVQG